MHAIPDGTGTPTQDELTQMILCAREERNSAKTQLLDTVITARAYGMGFRELSIHSGLGHSTVQDLIKDARNIEQQ